MPDENGVKATLEYIQRDIREIKEDVRGVRDQFNTMEAGRLSDLEKKFAEFSARVSAEMKPIRMLVYGLVAIILVAVVTAIVMIVIPNAQF